MKKKIMITFLASLTALSFISMAYGKENNDIYIYNNLKVFFKGVEDHSGKNGTYQNGKDYIPKTLIYANTTYVPLRYFSNMLGIKEVGWDQKSLSIWVNSEKPVADTLDHSIKVESFESYVHTGNSADVLNITFYPKLRLYFDGKEDTNGKEGKISNGTKEVPKTLIYKETTYVPLKYFANQLGIPLEEIGWDPTVPKVWVGSQGFDSLLNDL